MSVTNPSWIAKARYGIEFQCVRHVIYLDVPWHYGHLNQKVWNDQIYVVVMMTRQIRTRMSHQEEFDTRTSIDIQGTVPSVLGNLDDFIWGIALGKGGCW